MSDQQIIDEIKVYTSGRLDAALLIVEAFANREGEKRARKGYERQHLHHLAIAAEHRALAIIAGERLRLSDASAREGLSDHG